MMRGKLWALTLLMVFALVGWASATEYRVSTYEALVDALGAAQSGDVIVITGDITATKPIQIQKSGITVRAEPGVTVSGTPSHVVFLIGAAWEFDTETSTYESVTVENVVLEGAGPDNKLKVAGGDIGVLVKNAKNVTVRYLDIGGTDEGIRLIDASSCTIEDNTIASVAGIGIFLQESHRNTLKGNIVTGCGLGLFIYKSQGNAVDGDTYTENENGGVVLNDSWLGNPPGGNNVLQNLTVTENVGWGVRFVFSDGNKLLNSLIRDNTWGGVELLGSQKNTVEGNIVYNNGTADDDSDDAQIVITHGDKAEFYADPFAEYNTRFAGYLEHFVEEKHEVLDKLALLEVWIDDLRFEINQLIQKVATAYGMAYQGDDVGDIIDFIEEIIAEKHAIIQPQTPSGIITRGMLGPDWYEYGDETQTPPVVFTSTVGRDSLMGDPAYNFTLEDAEDFEFGLVTRDKLEAYSGYGTNFGLDYTGDPLDPNDDHVSWDKLRILDIIIQAIYNEIWNNDDIPGFGLPNVGAVDSLKEKVEYFYELGLITEQDRDDLLEKLDAVIGFVAQLEELLTDGLALGMLLVDDSLGDAIAALNGGSYEDAMDALMTAKAGLEAMILAGGLIEDYIGIIERIRYKLCLVDLELPPFPEVNTNLVGKKEKPVIEITTGGNGSDEIGELTDRIVDSLNNDTNAQAIRDALDGPGFSDSDISVAPKPLRCSTGNTIASNLISSDLMAQDRQIGIVIECPHNTIVNNVITNEKVLPIDSETGYGEFHRLDIAMILLADECTIAYNAIEWVNVGIIRGGKWYRKDIQVEYYFAKLARAAYWPEPGLSRTGCDDPTTDANDPTTYTGDHFASRVVVWVPVLSVSSRKVGDDPGTTGDESIWLGFEESQRVRRNRIALNLFEYVGTSIDIVDAESNVIDENLFYNCANGILFRAPGKHPWWDGVAGSLYDNPIGGAGPNIILEKNDYYSGVAIHNESNYAVGADRDYTPPEGMVGHATVIGHVTKPAARDPNSYENFGTIAKYVMLGIEKYYPGDDAAEILPPNLAFFYEGVVLPPEKVRHPDEIFGVPEVVCMDEDFPAGWNMVSSPVDPTDPDPEKVFGDDVPFLVMWEWDGTQYVEPTSIEGTRGYWILLIEEASLDVCGNAPTTDVSFDLAQPGWHMISTLTTPVYFRFIKVIHEGEERTWPQAVSAGWVRPFAYWWDPTAEEYKTILPDDGVLRPWRGYWIKTVVENVTLVLPIEYSLQNPPDVPPDSLSIKATEVSDELPPPPPPMPKPDLSSIDVVNEPNPVRDVNTTTFRVVGPAALYVEAMRVRIFDASGRLVYEAEVEGPELVWHTQDLTGVYLANGVYLYRVEVKVAGQWVTTEVKKLAIYR